MIHLLLVIGIILLIAWIIGLATRHTFGGVIHVVLVIALILVVIWLLRYFGILVF
jgi:hypothetical protein